MNEKQKKSASFFSMRAPIIGFAILVVVAAGLVVDANKADQDNFYSDIIRLDNVATRIHQSYVEPVDSKELINHAVQGMLEILDPHTNYFEEKQYEELRIHTEGKFGGLGIQISIRDKVLTVMTPIAGTPASRAGIVSGDQILEIDRKSTKGISIDDAVKKLRGEPGTEVQLKIRRKGEAKDLDFTLTREVIHIHSIPFYGLLDNNIGYIRLASFSEDAGREVEKAIKDLLGKGISGLVFDLRLNPGGLLPQAIEVSEKFLPKKSLVVQTRGRNPDQNKEFFAASNPVLPKEIPLVVLVNAASASASEIVAGAIQDWDRGVIVGDTTFGKGSVQSILPLNDNNYHLKITTAFYYTPSGRCINKPENAIRGAKAGAASEGDESDTGESTDSSAAKPDSAEAKKDTTVYKTKNGRIVYGGGGIIPDSVVVEKTWPYVIQALFGKDVFFKFANFYYPKLKEKKIKITKDFKVTDALRKEFFAFLDSTGFKFQSIAQVRYNEFKTRAGLADSAADTAPKVGPIDESLQGQELESLKKASREVDSILARASSRTLRAHNMEIDRYLTEALLIRELGQDHDLVQRSVLAHDTQLKFAISILQKKAEYERFLTPSKK